MVLNPDELRGVFNFVPTPWDGEYELDEAALRHDVEYLCESPLTGLYTTDSTGEFYTLEFEEFCRLVDVVLDVAGPTETPVQINCTWTNQRGALRRAEYAAEQGADAVRFAFPYWHDLTIEEAIRFVEKIARAAEPAPLVHYNIPRSTPVFGAEEYRRLVDRVPSLIGTKSPLDESSVLEMLTEVPELRHFVGDHQFVALMGAGADGMYSWLGVLNPRLTMEWYEACVGGDWSRAMEIQTMVWRYRYMIDQQGWDIHTDAGYNKLDAAVNPNIETHPRVRPPYTSGTLDQVETVRTWIAENEPELLDR